MADARIDTENQPLLENFDYTRSTASEFMHDSYVLQIGDAEDWAQAYGNACYAAGVEAGRVATPSPPVAPPATPGDMPWNELRPLMIAVMEADAATHGVHTRGTTNWAAAIAKAVVAAQPQPQPQPAQPLTGASQDAVVQALKDAIGVISSINGGHANKVMKNGEAVYWQRKEWIDWARLEVMPTIEAALSALTAPSTPTPEVAP